MGAAEAAEFWRRLLCGHPASVFRVLVLGLAPHLDHHGRARPGQRRIARNAGCSVSTANAAIATLRELGVLLQTYGGGARETCRYQVTAHYLGPVKALRRDIVPTWPEVWKAGTVRSAGRTQGYAKKPVSEIHPPSETDAARVRERGQDHNEDGVSQPGAAGLWATPEPRSEPAAPAVAERRAIARAKRRNQAITLRRWVQRSPLAGTADERLALAALIERAVASLADWGGRPERDRLAYDALAARVRRDPLPAELARCAWQEEQGSFGAAAEALRRAGWFHGGGKRAADLERRAEPEIPPPRPRPSSLAPPDLGAVMAARLARAGLAR